MKNKKVILGVLAVLVVVAIALFASNPALFQGRMSLQKPSNITIPTPPTPTTATPAPYSYFVTRAYLAEKIVEALALPTQPCMLYAAPDVPADHKNCPAIKAIRGEDIMNYTLFRPDQIINRAELAKIAVIIFDVRDNTADTESGYRDVPTDEWFAHYITALVRANALNGRGKFYPGSKATSKFLDQLFRAIRH